MGLFGGKKSKEPEAPAPVVRAPEPVARTPEPAPSPAPQAAPAPAPVAAAPAPQPAAAAPAAAPSQQAAAPSGPPLSEEEQQKAINESQQAMLAVGHIMTFLMNSEDIKNTTLLQARTLVWPAVMHRQFLVAMGQSNASGHITPVGVALWANVSDEINARLDQEVDKPFNLSPADWNSGTNTWLIMVAGDPRAMNPMVADMQRRAMNNRPLKMRLLDKDGKPYNTVFENKPTEAA